MSLSERLDACARVLHRHDEMNTEFVNLFREMHETMKSIQKSVLVVAARVDALEAAIPKPSATFNDEQLLSSCESVFRGNLEHIMRETKVGFWVARSALQVCGSAEAAVKALVTKVPDELPQDTKEELRCIMSQTSVDLPTAYAALQKAQEHC